MDYNKEQKQDRKTLFLAAIAVLVILNLVLVYFIYKEKQEGRDKDGIITAKTQEVLATKMKLDSISTELDQKIAEIRELGGEVDALEAMKVQLEKDKAEIQSNSNYSVANLNKKIKSYEAVLNEKDVEIANLKEQLGIVTSEKEVLSQQVTGLESEKQQLSDTIVSYSTKNQELSEKVAIASALRAESISVNAVSPKGKERDGGSYKAKRIDKLKVSFKIAENAVAKQNEKEIFMRILDPNGAVLSDMATGSGSFSYGGKETIYSSKQNINFTNTNQSVNVFYGRGGVQLMDGKYTVELYSEGFKIGKGEFTVK